jgi:hypothetical protein
MIPIIVMDNQGHTKSFDFSPWGGIEGFLSATSVGSASDNKAQLRKLVPWLQKGVTMTGNAVSQLPYSVRDEGGNEVPDSVAWGAVSNPRHYIKLVAASLCGGAGYLLTQTTSRALVSLQYVMPGSMTPNYNPNGDLVNFTRQMKTKTQTITPENVIYFWLPDDTVETGPAQITPLVNASLPAELISSMDSSFAAYAKRGFIPPTILAVKGLVNAAEREKTEKWWNAFLRGWTSTVAKIVNGEAVTPQTIGAGMDEFRDTYDQISKLQIENIAASFNIPLSLFMSNAANYATANADRKTWYETGVFIDIYQCVEDTLNTQLFNRFGWHLQFEPERLDAFQEDEAGKANAVATLASTLAQYPEEFLIVCDALGVELSEEQKALILEMAEEKEPPTGSAQPPSDFPQMGEHNLGEGAADEVAGEMLAWRKFAKKGHSREFETKHIPPALELRIRAGLKGGGDVDAVFDALANEPASIALARAINRAVAR